MAINLGNIVSIGGKSVGSGIASGLDTEALIKSLTDARRLPATKIEDTIKTNDTKVTEFNELRTILDTLNTSVNFLRNPRGLGSTSINVFEFRTTSISSNTSETASGFLTASAAPGTTKGTFDFAVGQLAKARVLRTEAFTTQTESVVGTVGGFNAGTFDLAPVIATEVDATVDTAETLVTGDYSVIGTGGSSVLDGAGFTVSVAGDGNTGLVGQITLATNPIGGNYSPTEDELQLSFTINGKIYTSNVIATDAGVSGEAIADGTVITFTNADTGTSITMTTSGDYEIGNDVDPEVQVDNVNAFISALQTDIAPQTILQKRNVSSFTNADVRQPITGLTQSHIVLNTDNYLSTGALGDIGGFTITRNGANDTDISVEIGGVTFTATGLADNQTGNITLTSAGNDTLELNIDDANIAFDFSSQDDADAVAASLDYAFGTRDLVGIPLAAGNSLVDVAAAINARTTDTGVIASIIRISSTDFRLQLSATQEGADNSFAIVDDSGVWTNIDHPEVQAAQDSIFAVDGIVTTRGSNTITDVITGLTLNLTKVTDSFTTQGAYNGIGSKQLVSLTVDDDTETAKNGIVNFVNAYNAYRVFVAEQTTRDEKGELLEGAVLNADTTLNLLINQLGVEVTRSVDGTSDNSFSALGNIGLTIVDFAGDATTIATKGILQYDDARLSNALAANFDKLREVFEFRFNASSAALTVFKTANSVDLTDFKVEVVNATTVNVRDANTNAILFQMDREGSLLTGRDDTALEGMEFIFSGTNGDIITVHMSQGIGDRFYNILNPMLEDDGTIDRAITNVTDNKDRLQTEVDRIDEQIEKYRDELIRQYSAVEESVSRINTLLSFLDQNSKAVFDN